MLIRAVRVWLIVVALGLGSAACGSPGESEESQLEVPEVSGDSVSSCSPGAADGVLPDSFWGMHLADPVGDGFPEAPIDSVNLTTAQVYWNQVETAPGEYTFDRLDDVLETSKARGAQPMLVLGFTPAFHASDPASPEARTMMPNRDAWQAWITAVVERYGDGFDYQIWPEPNIVSNWTGTPQEMAQLTVDAGKIIDEAAPDALVVSPATALRLEPQQKWLADFFDTEIDGDPVGDFVDAVALDPFPFEDGSPVDGLELVCVARQILADRGVEVPVWTNEINYGVPSGGGATEVKKYPKNRQVAEVTQTYLLHAAENVERVYWLGWFNAGGLAIDLADGDGETTAAGQAYVTVREWLDAGTRPACAVDGKIFTCAAASSDAERRIYWTEKGETTVAAPEGAAREDLISGDSREVSGGEELTVGQVPISVVIPR